MNYKTKNKSFQSCHVLVLMQHFHIAVYKITRLLLLLRAFRVVISLFGHVNCF